MTSATLPMEFFDWTGLEPAERSAVERILYSSHTSCPLGNPQFLWQSSPEYAATHDKVQSVQAKLPVLVQQQQQHIAVPEASFNGGGGFPPASSVMHPTHFPHPQAPMHYQPQPHPYAAPMHMGYAYLPPGAVAAAPYMQEAYLPYYRMPAQLLHQPPSVITTINHMPSEMDHSSMYAMFEQHQQLQLQDMPVHESSASVSYPAVKTHERRNKKRRPHDYYKKLEAAEQNSVVKDANVFSTDVNKNLTADAPEFIPEKQRQALQQDKPSVLYNGNARTEEHLPVMNGGATDKYSSQTERDMLAEARVSYLPPPPPSYEQEVARSLYRPPSPPPETIEEEPMATEAETMPQDTATPVVLSNGQVGSEHEDSMSPVEVTKTVDTPRVASPTAASHQSDAVSSSNNYSAQSIPGEKETEKDDSVVEGNLSEPPAKEEIVAELEPVKIVKTKPAPKPSSWAGLFSSTKQAQNATVIYSSQSMTSTNGKEEAVPVTVPAVEDKAAQFVGEMLNQYALKHKSISLQPRGLTNNGVWCYINATLQALVACPPFYHLMMDLPNKPRGGATSTPVMDSMAAFVHEFTPKAMKAPDNKALNGKGTVKMDLHVGKPFEPSYIYQLLKLKNYDGAFKHGRQEDAEEFVSCVLNDLHDEMTAVMQLALRRRQQRGGSATPSINGHCSSEEEEEEEAAAAAAAAAGEESPEVDRQEEDCWAQVGPKNKSVITRSVCEHDSVTAISAIFRGKTRSTVAAPGERDSATLQPFFSLQLDIQPRDVRCVGDALQQLLSKEALHGYTSSVTRQVSTEASRRTVLEELPPVLLLHLKCFVYDDKGGSQKLTKHIEYSVDLEINKDLLAPTVRTKYNSPASRKYKLFAVVNHHGPRAVGGHYTAYTFHPGLNGWLHVDDGLIVPVSLPALMKYSPPKVPYLLYYRKCDVLT